MKLVPYCFTHPAHQPPQLQLTCLWVFVSSAGKRLWQTEEASLTDEEILTLYCEPNGLPVIHIQRDPTNHCVYLEVDATHVKFSEFYSWEEAMVHPEKPECWRRFVFFEDAKGTEWWSPKGLVEAELPDLGSVASLWSLKRTRESIV